MQGVDQSCVDYYYDEVDDDPSHCLFAQYGAQHVTTPLCVSISARQFSDSRQDNTRQDKKIQRIDKHISFDALASALHN